MIHLLRSLADGSTQLVDVPVPAASGVSLVVESRASVVSAGTERMLVDFGRAGWVEKARRQPDKVRQVQGELLALYAAGRLKPHVMKIQPLESFLAALELVASRRVLGKVVLAMK